MRKERARAREGATEGGGGSREKEGGGAKEISAVRLGDGGKEPSAASESRVEKGRETGGSRRRLSTVRSRRAEVSGRQRGQTDLR